MRVAFTKGRVLVIGDLMLDCYHIGSVSRISPEAPVPVVKVTGSHDTLGGAGNVANNLAHLHARVRVIGPLGNDENGSRIRALCLKNGIDLVSVRTARPTTTKTRVIGERQQIVRIDFEQEFSPNTTELASAKKAITKAMGASRVVVLSDYGKGFCSADLCAFVIRAAKRRNLPVIVDPKGHTWNKYRGAAMVTPNVKELSDIAGHAVPNNDRDIASHARTIRSRFGLGSLLVTRSEKGMSLVTRQGAGHFPTEAREVFDVSGAGDTVVATLAAALANGYSLTEAVTLANKAAGIVVGKIGTVPIEIKDLRAVFQHDQNPKLLSARDLIDLVRSLRTQQKKIVFTNGCFDILHRGHVHLLHQAKKLGDVLVVALNSDRSDRRIKGTAFPINNEFDRAHIVAAIDDVDYLTLFNEKTPLSLIKKIRPDVIVKGGNYAKGEILGREFAGRAVIIPQLAGYSQEEIARKIALQK